jgi:hypothetical protein
MVAYIRSSTTEDTMSAPTTFAHIIMQARQHVGMTAAEMDFSLTQSDGDAHGALRTACWMLANPSATRSTGSPADKRAKADALWSAVDGDAEYAAMVERAKAKSYTGWSVQSQGPVRYAR